MDSVTITLPDGSKLDVSAGSTIEEIAYQIGQGLGDDCYGGRVNGHILPKEYELTESHELSIITNQSEAFDAIVNYTAAEILGHSISKLDPESVLIGGGISTSSSSWRGTNVTRFYYDVVDSTFTEDDLDRIRKEMQQIRDLALEVSVTSIDYESVDDQLQNRFLRSDSERKIEGGDQVYIYQQGEFTDCGAIPHLDNTSEVEEFELRTVSAVQHEDVRRAGEGDKGQQGDDKSQLTSEEASNVTRIWGSAFESEATYQDYKEYEVEIKERDHRQIGRKMDLFTMFDYAPGRPHFYPNGQVVLNELKDFIRSLDEKAGFQEVQTPELNKMELWRQSGHYEFFFQHDDAYGWDESGEEVGLKPTDCPNHMNLFKSKTRSYRDLPVRYSEIATLYRKFQSGELEGITRARRYTQPDGHVFVRQDQVADEIMNCIGQFEAIADTFGLDTNYKISTRPESSIGKKETWQKATRQLQTIIDEQLDGESELANTGSAFYGPKIRGSFVDSLGRKWKGSGYQLDYVLPERFNLEYIDENGEKQRPVLIHRGLLVSFEYLMALIIEEFNGEFPFWLAPTQVRILPISDMNQAYAEDIKSKLSDFRIEIDNSQETLSKKIRDGYSDKIPYMLIVGEDEEKTGTVTVRDRMDAEAKQVEIASLESTLQREEKERFSTTKVVDMLT